MALCGEIECDDLIAVAEVRAAYPQLFLIQGGLAETAELTVPIVAPVMIPLPDILTPIFGALVLPTWEAYAKWGQEQGQKNVKGVSDTAPVTGDLLKKAIDIAIGEAVKTVSGPINDAVDFTKKGLNDLRHHLEATQIVVYGGFSKITARLDAIDAKLDHLTNTELPDIHRQFDQNKVDLGDYFKFNSAADRQWSKDNIWNPLEEDINKERADRNIQRQHDQDNLPGIVKALIPASVLAAGPAIANLIGRVGALEKEAEECTKPMCNTMGPKTDLGKFLKTAKIAEWLATLAAIAALSRGDLDDVLGQIQQYGANMVNTIDGAFLSGGKTLAETIAGAGAP